MKFTILILAAPVSSQGSDTALRFVKAAIAAGHEIHRIFFYQDGVQSTNALAIAPQDEKNLPQAWQSLLEKHQIDAVTCIAAAIRRGVIDDQEAKRYEKSAQNLISGVELSGLGQLVSAAVESDRVISFGGHR